MLPRCFSQPAQVIDLGDARADEEEFLRPNEPMVRCRSALPPSLSIGVRPSGLPRGGIAMDHVEEGLASGLDEERP